MSVKFQVTLPESFAAELRHEADRMQIPLAQWIRQVMEQELRQRRRRTGEPPLAWLDRIQVDDEQSDTAARVDEILYGSSRLR